MDLLPLAMIQSADATRRELFSALPGAPVVPPRPRRSRAVRTRSVTAHLLERAAAAVAPKPSCSAAH
jgi:hypothetical protein